MVERPDPVPSTTGPESSADDWWQVRVAVAPTQTDALSGWLWEAGVGGIAETSSPGDRVHLVVSVRTGGLDPVRDVLAHQRVEIISVEPVAAHTGADAWRSFATPCTVGSWEIHPAWLAVSGGDDEMRPTHPGRTILRLDPGRAFGSGSHPSTRLALRLLAELDVAGRRVLDVGCGSGVLSVAAALAGAGAVRAIDLDAEAVRATQANAAANSVADRVAADDTPLDRVDGHHDVVLANLTATVLRELAPALRSRTEHGGHLVLAGLLTVQADEVLEAFGGGPPVRTAVEGEWTGLLLSR